MNPFTLVPVVLMGQFFGGPSRLVITAPDGGMPVVGVHPPVEVAAPDGGLEVFVPGRLTAAVTTDPLTWLAVAGDSSGARLEVSIPGTVSLSSSTLSALNGRFCTPGGQRKEGVAGTVVGIPPIPGDGGTGAFPGRTSISVSVSSTASGYLSCYASGLVGGTDPVCTPPTAGATTAGFELTGTTEMEISDAYVLRCLHCTTAGAPSGTTVTASYIEMDCNQ